ncbi:MAG: IS110 family transposase [Sphaerochaetaceae bacterium]|nr:IS110 family transposase [Sphaerochaetaceae bacterium]
MESVVYAGMDVHKESISLAVITGAGEIILEKRIGNSYPQIRKEFVMLKDGGHHQIHCCYEAGPTGYGLAREINSSRVATCFVVAPGNIPKRTRDRVKTDRRDALKLGRLLALHDISTVYVPDEEDESVRELLRYRKKCRDNMRRSKQQLKSLLLRQGKHYLGRSNWSKSYKKWVSSIDFGSGYTGQVRNSYLDTVERLSGEIKDLDRRLNLVAANPRYAAKLEKLRLLRGIGLITGLALLMEVGDYRRFATAKSFMAWLGLVPGENSSGERRSQGKLTKTGNIYLRTLLIEAAWHYAYGGKFKDPRIGKDSILDQKCVNYARRADKRLHDKFIAVQYRSNKSKNVAVAATARELAGFVWGMMNEEME